LESSPPERRGKSKKEIIIMRIGPQEFIIVLIIVLVIFGPKNLPKLGKMFGKTMKNFKEGMEDVDENGDAKPAETKTEEKAEKKDEE
jgi:twin arginine-targeting protein translocase, tatA/E family